MCTQKHQKPTVLLRPKLGLALGLSSGVSILLLSSCVTTGSWSLPFRHLLSVMRHVHVRTWCMYIYSMEFGGTLTVADQYMFTCHVPWLAIRECSTSVPRLSTPLLFSTISLLFQLNSNFIMSEKSSSQKPSQPSLGSSEPSASSSSASSSSESVGYFINNSSSYLYFMQHVQ